MHNLHITILQNYWRMVTGEKEPQATSTHKGFPVRGCASFEVGIKVSWLIGLSLLHVALDPAKDRCKPTPLTIITLEIVSLLPQNCANFFIFYVYMWRTVNLFRWIIRLL